MSLDLPVEFTPNQYLEAVRSDPAFDLVIDGQRTPSIVVALESVREMDRQQAIDRLQSVTFGDLYDSRRLETDQSRSTLRVALGEETGNRLLSQVTAAHWPELPSHQFRYTEADALDAMCIVANLPRPTDAEEAEEFRSTQEKVLDILSTNPFDPALPSQKRDDMTGLICLGRLDRIARIAQAKAEGLSTANPVDAQIVTGIVSSASEIVSRNK